MTNISDSPLFSYSYERLDVNDFNVTFVFKSRHACKVFVDRVYEILDIENDAMNRCCGDNVTYYHVDNISRMACLARLVSDYVWYQER